MTGREKYHAARVKALAAQQRSRPRDPQQAGTPGDSRARVADLARPCQTPVDGGVCGASGFEHDMGTQDGQPARTACSVMTAAGACGCPIYAP